MLVQQPYVGRFAPSPTGPLHFGSLLTAVASFCEAKAHGGQWLVRIEDTDTPRIQAGSESAILQALDAFALYSDAAIIRQRERIALYDTALHCLAKQQLIYACQCSRKALAGYQVYNNRCRNLGLDFPHHAIRLKVLDQDISFEDALQGHICSNLLTDLGDFILKRRDGIVSYQLAVVVDDALQGISHVVRGADLIDNTARQMYLAQCLGYTALKYMHLPLAMNAKGQKLSKQNLAKPLDLRLAPQLLQQAISALGQAQVSLDHPEIMLRQTVAQWDASRIAAQHYLSGQYV